jgi:hypothetical protein
VDPQLLVRDYIRIRRYYQQHFRFFLFDNKVLSNYLNSPNNNVQHWSKFQMAIAPV